MGIKHFWGWFKNQFSQNMHKMRRGKNLSDINVSVDNLMIDMNGVFHNSAQKIYQYGNFKPNPRLLRGRKPPRKLHGLQAQLRCFEDICKTVETLFKIVDPKKRLILCVDGPAPISKQNQQRQRRYRSAMESADDAPFNNTCITPGTKFMDYLSKYIDWYIRKRISEDPAWQRVQIIFSNEKAPGEGEQKCFLRGTLILLWNGSTQAVEEIKIGDQVIGDDGTFRTVTELVSGEDEMYEIIQNNAENYTVNKHHILSLKIADHKRIYWSEKEGAWITGLYDRVRNCYTRKQFSGLRENEKRWFKMADKDRTCTDCDITYSTRENYAKHMKKHHSITVSKMKTTGRTVSKTKEEAETEARKFLSTISDDDVLDISVADYLQLTTNTQSKLYGFRSPGIEWPEKKVNIDPYLLGLWLGDGVSTQPTICTVDDEIVLFLNKFCDEHNFKLTNNDKYITYRICDPVCGGPVDKSRIISAFKSYNLIKNKHIPREYLVNNAKTRLKMLAGIIDSDGNLTKDGRLVRISQCEKHKQLVDDIVYLARSLGFCVNVRKAKSSHVYKGEKKNGTCYQITISGDIDTIPTLIARKKCSSTPIPGENGRSIVVDKLRTSIKVQPVGKDKYYGFNTDGNHRFLLGDFTVTHNCINYIRYHGKPEETYCIQGMDADLIMLALGTHMPNFYILREDIYDPGNEFFCIDIGTIRGELAEVLRWEEGKYKFDAKAAIDDFIFLCFMVGNDFLPHIPSIEIIERGIELIVEVYKEVGTSYGHVTCTISGRVQFCPKPMGAFFGTIGQHEKENFEHKLGRKESFFPDPLMESCATQSIDGGWEIDMEKYKTDYYAASFPKDTDEKKLCHEYFEGMQWVLSYYTRGVPNWKWHFAYHYAPPASVLAKHIETFVFPRYGRTTPTTPFQQLLCVLPPKSADLIPEPLCQLLTDPKSPLKEHCPDDFEIDLSGKRKEWEGIVLLPMVDFSLVRECYMKKLHLVDKRDLKRNVTGRSFVYEYVPTLPGVFRSYYGDIERCCVQSVMIDL
jgi:uncharacterized C2H2 Zn-finger protein